jgi:hypothetical protein
MIYNGKSIFGMVFANIVIIITMMLMMLLIVISLPKIINNQYIMYYTYDSNIERGKE